METNYGRSSDRWETLGACNRCKVNKRHKGSYCVECRAKYNAEYKQRNKPRLNELQRLYRKTPKARIAHKNAKYRRESLAVGKFTAKEWQQLCEKHGFICLRCKQKKTLQVDHIKPLSKQGLNTLENIQPLCAECNRWKSTKYIDYRGDLL